MPYVPPEDELARRKKDYYRNKRPDLDPQSNVSWLLEQVGLDEPYRNDSGSYDYRKKAWDESVAEGNPDVGWFLPELNDESVSEVGGFLERALGYWNPAAYIPGMKPIQRPSQDERLLSQLSPEDRKLIESIDPNEADAVLLENFPNWEPKRNPFPSSWMGKKDREGNAAAGSMAHVLEQWDWVSPYSARDIASLATEQTPETFDRDVAAWKGGSSSLDRTIAGAAGVDEKAFGEPSKNPLVDPVEWGSLGISLGAPGMVASAGRGAVKGAKALGNAGRAVQKYAQGRKKPPIAWRGPPSAVQGEIGGAKARFRKAGKLPEPTPRPDLTLREQIEAAMAGRTR